MSWKTKRITFGTQNASFWYFKPEFEEKAIVIFEISSLKLLKMQSFVLKKSNKKLKINLGQKLLSFDIFGISGLEFEISILEFIINKILSNIVNIA